MLPNRHQRSEQKGIGLPARLHLSAQRRRPPRQNVVQNGNAKQHRHPHNRKVPPRDPLHCKMLPMYVHPYHERQSTAARQLSSFAHEVGQSPPRDDMQLVLTRVPEEGGVRWQYPLPSFRGSSDPSEFLQHLPKPGCCNVSPGIAVIRCILPGLPCAWGSIHDLTKIVRHGIQCSKTHYSPQLLHRDTVVVSLLHLCRHFHQPHMATLQGDIAALQQPLLHLANHSLSSLTVPKVVKSARIVSTNSIAHTRLANVEPAGKLRQPIQA